MRVTKSSPGIPRCDNCEISTPNCHRRNYYDILDLLLVTVKTLKKGWLKIETDTGKGREELIQFKLKMEDKQK